MHEAKSLRSLSPKRTRPLNKLRNITNHTRASAYSNAGNFHPTNQYSLDKKRPQMKVKSQGLQEALSSVAFYKAMDASRARS